MKMKMKMIIIIIIIIVIHPSLLLWIQILFFIEASYDIRALLSK